MDTLPVELLERVLLFLRVSDLVACRKVCRRWRAMVRAIEARDAAFVFRCGTVDVLREWHQNPTPYRRTADLEEELDCLGSNHCTCGADFRPAWPQVRAEYGSDWSDVEEDTESDDEAEDGEAEDGEAEDGEVEDEDGADESAAEHAQHPGESARQSRESHAATAAVPKPKRTPPPGWYKAEHGERFPPGRWQVLAAERALTLELTEVARELVQHSSVFKLSNYQFHAQWLPWFVYLPVGTVLPRTLDEMQHFLHLLFYKYETLDTVETALASYAAAEKAAVQHRSNLVDLIRQGAEQARFDRWTYARRRELGLFGKYGWGVYLHRLNAYIESAKHGEDSEEARRQFAELCKSHEGSHSVQADRARAWIHAARAYEAAKAGGAIEPLLLDYDWEAEAAWTTADFDAERAPQAPPPGANADRDEWWKSCYGKLEVLGSLLCTLHPLFREETEQLAEQDASGWSTWRLEARQSAAAWRIACALGWSEWLRTDPHRSGTDMLFHCIDWQAMSDDDVQAFLDEQVAEVDSAAKVFASRCHLPVVARHRDGMWVGGLSPQGHLVGALIIQRR